MPSTKACLSPTLNGHALTEKFHNNADLMPTSNMELRALHEADPIGKVQTVGGDFPS